MYDITDAESFEHVDSWMQEIKKFTAGTDVRVMVIGNKVGVCVREGGEGRAGVGVCPSLWSLSPCLCAFFVIQ